ncbi:hypothetical protein E2C01_042561 [Portunus trituberculatus]|uniref:Uncharacterized protein n=1 Tax=Portunus trituberculatus TaxID=210409 RepID=A0A5B7FTY7_PORTR|nr:hypothetical protein [Portunus trituberculatus]
MASRFPPHHGQQRDAITRVSRSNRDLKLPRDRKVVEAEHRRGEQQTGIATGGAETLQGRELLKNRGS